MYRFATTERAKWSKIEICYNPKILSANPNFAWHFGRISSGIWRNFTASYLISKYESRILPFFWNVWEEYDEPLGGTSYTSIWKQSIERKKRGLVHVSTIFQKCFINRYLFIYFKLPYLSFVVDIADFFDHELEIVVPWKRLVDQVGNWNGNKRLNTLIESANYRSSSLIGWEKQQRQNSEVHHTANY